MLLHDVRSSVRAVLRSPVITAVIVLSFALGIGINTMIFSLVNGLLLLSLPYPHADRLVALWFTAPGQPTGRGIATPRNCAELGARDTPFEHVGCYVSAPASLFEGVSGTAEPERLEGERFTSGTAEAIGVNPSQGRWFTAEEDRAGASAVAVISHSLWERRFAGASDILGKKVRLDDEVATIIGVMPSQFEFVTPNADYWMPLRDPVTAMRSSSRIRNVVALLKSGTTLAQAQSRMDRVAADLAGDFPASNKGWGIRLEPFRDAFTADLRGPLQILEGVVAFVLLIACANVASLLLVRGVSQRKQLAVRLSLGATRLSIVRQLLIESVLLALCGGAVGLGIAYVGFRLAITSLPAGIPYLSLISLNTTVLMFMFVLSLVTGVVAGILPALQISGRDLLDALRESGRNATPSTSRQSLHGAFVVVQISLSLLLLIGAGLLIKSFLRLYSVRVGFDPQNLMTFQIQFQGDEYIRQTGRTTPSGSVETELAPRITAVTEQIREGLTHISGVQSATAMGQIVPLSGRTVGLPFDIDGRVGAQDAQALSTQWYPVFADYFTTLGIPVRRGRDFTVRDSATGPPVVIISATTAERYFPGEDPLGRQIRIGFLNDPPRQIVGIVGDVRQNTRQQRFDPQMYVPYAQLPLLQEGRTAYALRFLTFIVRSAGLGSQPSAVLRSAVVETAPTLPVYGIQPLEQYLADQRQQHRQYVVLLGAFSVLALVLALSGVYGIIAHSVEERTNELGIRSALGASGGSVIRLVLGRGVMLMLIGIGIGVAASLALTRTVQGLLWGVTATDPLTFVVGVAILFICGLLACYIPARRALKIDLVSALR